MLIIDRQFTDFVFSVKVILILDETITSSSHIYFIISS